MLPARLYRLISIAFLAALAAACTAPATSVPGSGTLTVFAAASLTEAFTELGRQFEAGHPGLKTVFNFAGSQQLAHQIAQGAPVDVFASANSRQLDAAIESGRIVSGTQKTFVNNRLIVLYPKDNPADLNELKDLARPGLRLVLAAKEVPAGQYALDFLDKAAADAAYGGAFKDGVLKNVVSYEENVRSVLSKVVLGEADAGIVYTSDIGQADAGQVGRIDIPDRLNVLAAYPIAVVADSPHPDLAIAWIEWVLSSQGQAILSQYGFIPAGQ